MRFYAIATLSSLLVLVGTSTALAIPVGRLQLWSDPGDPVGNGSTYDLTFDNALGFSSISASDPLPGGAPRTVQFNFLAVPVNSVVLYFSTYALGTPIQPGFYPNAAYGSSAAPIPSSSIIPYMYFGFDGSSIYQEGSFTVHEATFSGVNGRNIVSFVVDFEQRANYSLAGLRGRFEYRQAGLAVIPEPSVSILILVGLAGLSCRRGPRSTG